MFYDKLKTALKSNFNLRVSNWINLTGLTVAFMTAFSIFSYVSYELSYDVHYQNVDRIYRISGKIITPDETKTHAVLGPEMGPALKAYFPEVKDYTRLFPFKKAITLHTDTNRFRVKKVYSADSSVVDFFDLRFIYGDPANALRSPAQVVINQTLSEKIFGKTNPVGQVLQFNNHQVTVSGVFADMPSNTHHQFSALFSLNNNSYDKSKLSRPRLSELYWMPSAFHFILLEKETQIENITENFKGFYEKYMAGFGQAINATFEPLAIPVDELHFSQHMGYDYPKGNLLYTYVLVLTAVFIILIAVSNYANLLISKNIAHSTNLGIRKLLGASEWQMFLHFSLNAFVVITTASIVAAIAFIAIFPIIDHWLRPEWVALNWEVVLLALIALIVLLSLLTAAVAFLQQYRKKAIHLLQLVPGNFTKMSGIKRGKLSVIFQFALVIVLLVVAIVTTRQLNFMLNQNKGFEDNNVLLLRINNAKPTASKIKTLKTELASLPDVHSTAYASNAPGDILGTVHFQIKNGGKQMARIVKVLYIDEDYIPLMEMNLSRGRNFRGKLDFRVPKTVILNKACYKYCGLSGSLDSMQINGTRTIGILDNLHFHSLHNPDEPIAFLPGAEGNGVLHLKIDSKNRHAIIGKVLKVWEEIIPEADFHFEFLSDRVELLYADDQQKNNLLRFFTFVSMLIAMMGLFNLASVIMQKKTKEVGIRKVNGAEPKSLLLLLNRQFIIWIIASFILAAPIAWYMMERWLQDFAHRISLNIWLFLLALFITMAIAIVTVTWQTWRAANKNPVNALRYE
jgi:putative ABC transport system permease protein